jgi:hypothetical protein
MRNYGIEFAKRETKMKGVTMFTEVFFNGGNVGKTRRPILCDDLGT